MANERNGSRRVLLIVLVVLIAFIAITLQLYSDATQVSPPVANAPDGMQANSPALPPGGPGDVPPENTAETTVERTASGDEADGRVTVTAKFVRGDLPERFVPETVEFFVNGQKSTATAPRQTDFDFVRPVVVIIKPLGEWYWLFPAVRANIETAGRHTMEIKHLPGPWVVGRTVDAAGVPIAGEQFRLSRNSKDNLSASVVASGTGNASGDFVMRDDGSIVGDSILSACHYDESAGRLLMVVRKVIIAPGVPVTDLGDVVLGGKYALDMRFLRDGQDYAQETVFDYATASIALAVRVQGPVLRVEGLPEWPEEANVEQWHYFTALTGDEHWQTRKVLTPQGLHDHRGELVFELPNP